MTHLPKVVLFDDDMSNLRLYNNYFQDHFSVKGFQNPFTYEVALQEDLSAIVIDVLMPVMDGIQLHGEIQSHHKYNGCPIIFISASGSEKAMLDALGSGGEDFLCKTMKKEEMIARISNKIDSFKKSRQIFLLGRVKVNTSELRAYYSNSIVELTLTEMRIMKFLMREFPKLSTREEITQEVWPDQKVLPTTLNTHLSNLRNKFPEWEYEIQFIKSKGIELVLKDQAVSL